MAAAENLITTSGKSLDSGEMMRTVLVVDDEEVTRRLVQEVLEPEGYTVLCAENSAAALDHAGRGGVGVAIVDKNLGDESGVDLIRELHSHSSFTKAILFTAESSVDSAVESMRLGAIDYLEKPVDIDVLIAKVGEAFALLAKDIERDKSTARHSLLFETIPGVVWFMTDQGIFRQINATGAELLGYPAAELAGKPYEMLLSERHKDDAAVHWAFKERRTGARATRRLLAELETADGEKRLFEIYSAGTYLETRHGDRAVRHYCGTVGVAHDITDRTRLEQELQQSVKMDALGRLAGGVAHDFNNLLAVVQSNVQFILSQAGDNPPFAEELGDIALATKRGADLTHQLLAFSRKDVVNPTSVDLGEVIETMTTMIARLIGEDIEIDLQRAEGCGTIRADPTQLQQIAFNLAANARDAMPNGGTLSLRVAPVEIDDAFAEVRPNVRPGRYAMFAVSDSGSGMSPEVRAHIFEPFFTTKSTGHGTGLGLATVYGIVGQCGGFISVYSEKDLGTTVKVYFPQMAASGARVEVEHRSKAARCEGTVLLVEDEEMVRRSTRRVLASAGLTVIEAGNATEAIGAFERVNGDIDLLLTDVVMPGQDGTELARILRERRPSLPVVYMSGYVGKLPASFEMLEDRAKFVAKPFGINELLAAISALLDNA